MCNFSNGPWIAAFNGSWYEVKSHNEEWIADTCASSCKGDLTIGKVNAHLIAAAPEMYEMLELIVANCELSPHKEDIINKLLAKARGEHV